MIISFSIENWMSYRNKSELTFVATREQHHGERVTKVKRLQARFLPIAMLFGGNASGKTNFFRALDFAKFMVSRGYFLAPEARIPVEPYLLDADSRKKPTTMAFRLLIGDDVYAYEFSVDGIRVMHERLFRETAHAEDVRFERTYDAASGGYTYEYGAAHEQDRQLLELIAKSTRGNQLFLMTASTQNVKAFKPVYDWFDKTLCLIAPNAHYAPKERYADESAPYFARMNAILSNFDTGIKRIVRKPVSVDALPIPPVVVKTVTDNLKEGQTARVESTDRTWPYLLTRKDGVVTAEKLVACHVSHDGHEEEFELEHESDGTKRILDLLPAFVDMENKASDHVYVIDEIDRCLHTYAARKLVMTFLDGCTNDTRGQLLATTHDIGLLSQSLLRRDEMWLAERNRDEVSEIFAVSDFSEARKDTDLRKSYLTGRMGGLPSIVIR